MPPLATGVWLDQEAILSLIQRLVKRFKGSLETHEFCFPPAINHFTAIKH